MSTKKKKTYVVMHPDGTWSKRVSVKDTVYTAAIVKNVRLAAEHEYMNVKGARDARLRAAEYRARAAAISAGRYECIKAEPFVTGKMTYTYRDVQFPDQWERIYAATQEEADRKIAETVDYKFRAAEQLDVEATRMEATPAPAADAIKYGWNVEYRTDPRVAEAEVDKRNRMNDPVYYYHVAGVHLVPEGMTAKKYAESLQVPF